MASSDQSQAEALFAEASQAFEDLEAKASENSAYKRTAVQRKERLPHLSIKPTSAAEAAAVIEAAPVEIEPLTTEPAEVQPTVEGVEAAPEGS